MKLGQRVLFPVPRIRKRRNILLSVAVFRRIIFIILKKIQTHVRKGKRSKLTNTCFLVGLSINRSSKNNGAIKPSEKMLIRNPHLRVTTSASLSVNSPSHCSARAFSTQTVLTNGTVSAEIAIYDCIYNVDIDRRKVLFSTHLHICCVTVKGPWE